MHRRGLYGGEDLGFDFRRLDIEFRIEDRLGSEFHRRGKKGGHDANKPVDFSGVREVFFQVFHFSQEMSVAVLKGTRRFIVGGITIDDQNAGQGFIS